MKWYQLLGVIQTTPAAGGMASHTIKAAGLEANQTARAADYEPRLRSGVRLFAFEFQFRLPFPHIYLGEHVPHEDRPSQG